MDLCAKAGQSLFGGRYIHSEQYIDNSWTSELARQKKKRPQILGLCLDLWIEKTKWYINEIQYTHEYSEALDESCKSSYNGNGLVDFSTLDNAIIGAWKDENIENTTNYITNSWDQCDTT